MYRFGIRRTVGLPELPAPAAKGVDAGSSGKPGNPTPLRYCTEEVIKRLGERGMSKDCFLQDGIGDVAHHGD
jgi:hypothetical protein